MAGRHIFAPPANEFSMIIFLYGVDVYHRGIKQKEIIEQYKKKHSDLALQKFDLETKEDWQKFKDFTTAQSLFDNLKMAVVSGSFSELEDEKEFGKILQSHLENKNFYLLISTGDNKIKKDFNFLLNKPVISQEFKLLTGMAWKKFIGAESNKRNGLKWDFNNIEEGDCFSLINELNKIELVSPENIWMSGVHILKYDFFGAIQQIARGDFKSRLSNLEILLENDDPAKVFNLLAYSVRPEEQVKMADYDVAVKSGKMDYPEALLDFIL